MATALLTEEIDYSTFDEDQPLNSPRSPPRMSFAWSVGSSVYLPPIALSCTNLGYSVKKTSASTSFGCGGRSGEDLQLLQNICFSLQCGEMCAILGSSGAGKSTLMDILAGRYKPGRVAGSVAYSTMSGNHIDEIQWRKVIGYVMQDDALLATETVRETLMFSACARLPSNVTIAEKIELVNETMRALDLTHIADALVGNPDDGGGLSGGERKRLSIGVELVARPRVLLLDEPTSGLDSHSSEIVIAVLRSVANAGTTVIASVHQPTTAVFLSFDKVLLMARGGYQLYFGRSTLALQYFQTVPGVEVDADDEWINPAELLLEVSVGRTPVEFSALSERWADATKRNETEVYQQPVASVPIQEPDMHQQYGAVSVGQSSGVRQRQSSSRGPSVEIPMQSLHSLHCAPPTLRPSPSNWRRFLLLNKRGIRLVRRDPSLLLAQFLLTCVTALVIGGIFFKLDYELDGLHNRTGYLFFIVSYFTLLSMSSVSVLFTEKQAFCRERAAGFYSTLPYLASKLICDLIPLRVIPPLVYSGITYFMIGLNSWPDRVVTFFAMLVNVNVAAVAVCFILASLTANIQQANMFTSLVFVFNVLFGGFLLTARTTAIAGIMKLSLLNWAWRALMVNEFHGLTDLEFNAKGAPPVYITGDTWLVNFDVDVTSNKWIVLEGGFALAAITLVCVSGAYTAFECLKH